MTISLIHLRKKLQANPGYQLSSSCYTKFLAKKKRKKKKKSCYTKLMSQLNRGSRVK